MGPAVRSGTGRKDGWRTISVTPPASPIYAFTTLCVAWRAKSCADVWHVCRSLPGGRRGVSVTAVRLPGDAAAQEHSAAPARVCGFRRAGEWGGSRVTCRPALHPSFRACLRVARLPRGPLLGAYSRALACSAATASTSEAGVLVVDSLKRGCFPPAPTFSCSCPLRVGLGGQP